MRPRALTFALGKDISGRIRVVELESMPHLLIAGSTGSGKSVMLNTHDHVDPVQVHAGRGADDHGRSEARRVGDLRRHPAPAHAGDHRRRSKATNALRNAVLEMERRLKLLAATACGTSTSSTRSSAS